MRADGWSTNTVLVRRRRGKHSAATVPQGHPVGVGPVGQMAERPSLGSHVHGRNPDGPGKRQLLAIKVVNSNAEALTKADLVDTLKGAGPFNFAPTEEAFATAKARGVTAEQLLAREDLADFLKCHVATGAKVMSEDLKAREQMVGCLPGSDLSVTVEVGKVEVNDASVTAPGVNANNGVIHAIDKVLLLPSGPRGTAGTAVAAGSFTTLAAALTKAGLVKSFKGAGPFAVFTPIDEAFAAALKALGVTAKQLLAQEDLADTPKYPVVAGAKGMNKDPKAERQVAFTARARARVQYSVSALPCSYVALSSLQFRPAERQRGEQELVRLSVATANGCMHCTEY